jgi:hypothetical protein
MQLDGSGGVASVEFGPDPYADRWTYPGDASDGGATAARRTEGSHERSVLRRH